MIADVLIGEYMEALMLAFCKQVVRPECELSHQSGHSHNPVDLILL